MDQQKPKAIFIDGASLFHMFRIMGIAQINAQEFHNILQREVGNSSNLFGRPLYVVPEVVERFPTKIYMTAGFEVRKVNSENSGDDAEIRQTINSVNSEQISELVLVTTDILDYLDCLKAKAAQGIKVYIVATKEKDKESGRSALTSDFDLIIESNGFEFIELLPFKERLMTRAWEDRPRNESGNVRPLNSNGSNRLEARVEFSGSPANLAKLTGEFAKLYTRFPGIKISTEYK